MKDDFVMPILVLALICMFMSGALAVVNNITYPVISEAAAFRAEKAQREIIPEADGFVLIEADNLPATIKEVYGTTNNMGFVIVVASPGYGGEIIIMCGIDPDGKIIKSVALNHEETKGISDPVFAMQDQYKGKNKNLDGIDSVSGATITSYAYKNGILDAFLAFETVKGVQQ